jgi:hypothetical protein
MITALLAAIALQTASVAETPQLEVTPVILQNAVLFLSDDVTAGGAGGGAGAQLVYHGRYLAQLDVSALLTMGNAVTTRLAFGMQTGERWVPALWATFATLWGERLEFLTGDGRRPAIPTWSLGIRGAALRFAGEIGTISALEPGIGTDFSGGLWLELTLLQAGARF